MTSKLAQVWGPTIAPQIEKTALTVNVHKPTLEAYVAAWCKEIAFVAATHLGVPALKETTMLGVWNLNGGRPDDPRTEGRTIISVMLDESLRFLRVTLQGSKEGLPDREWKIPLIKVWSLNTLKVGDLVAKHLSRD